MTTFFGDPADFAIEAGTEPGGHTATHTWGHICVWCRGVALGDINERQCGLYHAYTEFHWRADDANLDKLWADELVGLGDVAAWNFLDGIGYGYHGEVELPDDDSLDELRKDPRWWRFNFLNQWGEQFDGYKAFLLCPPGDFARVLSRRLPEHLGRGVSVSRRGLLAAAAGFARWFEAESRRLGVPCERP